MRRSMSVLVGIVALLALATTTAFAVGPTSTTRTGGLHFVGTPDAFIDGAMRLNVVGEVAGAGKSATATLTYDVTITTGCINPGSKDHEPSGLQSTTTQESVSAPLRVTRQGRAEFDLQSATPTTGTRTCPRPMQPTVVDVTYSNILLTVTSQTGTVTATFPTLSAP